MKSGLEAFVIWGQSFWSRTATGSRHRGRTRPWRSALDVLEGRIAPATFLVLNAFDGPGSGPIGSLRNAVSRAEQSGDASNTVVITSKVNGPIALNSGELDIETSLNLVNRSGRPIAINQTTPGARVFHVTSDSDPIVVNIGATSSANTITIKGGNLATGNGGGILVDNPDSVLTLTHVKLIDNSAGLASSSNPAQNGGGIDSSGRVVLNQSTVGTAASPNQTSGDGGGIWAGAGVSMTGSTVNGNQAGLDGGGLFVSSGNTAVSQSRVDGNQGLNVGGIYQVQGDVRVVKGSDLDGNSSTAVLDVTAGNFGGGAIYAGIGSVFVSGSQVSANHSVGMYSSGIVVGLGSVTVTSGSRIDGNSNNGPGGGIAANFGGIVTVSGRSQVDGNTGSGIGGGIVNFAGPLGGVRVLGGSEVSHNTLTNGESLGQAVGVFLQLIAESLDLDFTTATGGTSAATVTADIASLDQATGSPALVAGGGIGTLLGASITVSGGSRVDDNFAGAQVSGGNPNTIAIGGGVFNPAGGTASILQSSLNSNRANSGGGIYNLGTLGLVNSSVVGNHATVQGGGITNKGQLTLVKTSVVANTPDNMAPTA